MTAPSSFQITQGYEVLPPKSSDAYPIPCAEWEHLKSKLRRLADEPWFFHTIGSALIGAGLSTLISILLDAFPQETAFRANVVAWAVVVVTILCGAACLYFAGEQRKVRVIRATDLLQEMDIIERRFERAV